MDKATKDFRVNALCILAQHGLTLKDFGGEIKKACARRHLVKNAFVNEILSLPGQALDVAGKAIGGAADIGKLTIGTGLAAATAAALLSMGAGYLGGKVIGHVTAPTEEDVELEKMKDQIHAYNRAIERQRGERIAREADKEQTKRKGLRISSAF